MSSLSGNPESRELSAGEKTNLRAFLAILQEWDHKDQESSRMQRGEQFVELHFTSTEESDMS